MKKILLSAFVFSAMACGKGDVTMTINIVGDPAALAASNGQDNFDIALDEGFLVFRNINIVSAGLDDEVPLLDAGQEIDFVADNVINLAAVEVPKVDYQQVHSGLDDTANVAFHALGTISINGGAAVPFAIDYALPAEDENQFDNAITFDGKEVTDSISIDLETLFSNIDFTTIEADLNGEVTIDDANAGTASVQAAIDAYTDFFGEANNNTMFLDN